MRSNSAYYAVLVLLTVVDGWLLGHPNLVGRFGIFFYDYSYLDTVPKAMLTVGGTVLAALVLGFVISKLPSRLNMILALALTLVCLIAAALTYQKFSSGTYQFTGSGFKTGAALLPLILTIVFGKTALDLVKKRK